MVINTIFNAESNAVGGVDRYLACSVMETFIIGHSYLPPISAHHDVPVNNSDIPIKRHRYVLSLTQLWS